MLNYLPTACARLPLVLLTLACAPLLAQTPGALTQDPGAKGVLRGAPNPYKLSPFHADFPVALEYPPRIGREYQATRRQILRRLASNLQGNVRPDSWRFATEFFWRAPDDAVEPLIETMDRCMGNPALGDVVRNCVQAMGKMGLSDFDKALRRALRHKKEATRQAAYSALAQCGTPETIRELLSDYTLMDGRARVAWLGAVRRKLPLEESTAMLTSLMNGNLPPGPRDEILKEARRMPAKSAAQILRGRWHEATGDFKAILAGVLHAAGDTAGTVWLKNALTGEDVMMLQHALRYCAFGKDPNKSLGDLREFVLQATTHQNDDVRLAALTRLLAIEGDDVTAVLEVLTAPGEAWDIRGVALRALTRRGDNAAVSAMLDELPTATGSRMRSLVNQLSASGDPRGVPIIVARYRKAGPGECRAFLQALAQNASLEAAEALCEIYREPDRLVAVTPSGKLTTRSYLPTLFLNLRGSEDAVVRLFNSLDKQQWRLRARLLTTLTGIAADRRGQSELQQRCLAPVRAVLFDREELPQLRVQALNAMKNKWLTVDDALKLKNGLRRETKSMRALFADFLLAYF